MLTTRSVIMAIISVAVLSVFAAVFSLFWVGETHSTLRRDSYGTRTEGYRAIHDLLEALEFDTERAVIPSVPQTTSDTSYVLWNPGDRFIQTEPTYLNALSRWVRKGGHLVVTPSAKPENSNDDTCRRCSEENCSTCIPVSLLVELGLTGVSLKEVEQIANEHSHEDESRPESFRDAVQDIFQVKKRPTTVYQVSCEGEWSDLGADVKQIELPVDREWEISSEELEPLAAISTYGWGDQETTAAAMFPLGEGRITIVGNPYLASNASLDEFDNSVLLTHLMTDMRKRVVFDEFYHGLTMRGNAMWLLSKRPYAIITISILAVVGIWVWRNAVFLGPSREETTVSRRTLDEYLEAMSRFLLKGRQSSRYILSEVRDGVLWHYSKVLGLPPRQQNLDTVLGLLSRRLPHKASDLEAAVKNADAVLNNTRARQEEILLATRKVSDCLSN